MTVEMGSTEVSYPRDRKRGHADIAALASGRVGTFTSVAFTNTAGAQTLLGNVVPEVGVEPTRF
jgi:hypothetical protein